MNRLIEILLGFQRGFLSREGDVSLRFEPRWPGGEFIGQSTWNFLLLLLVAYIVVFIYRREGGSRRAKLVLGTLRAMTLLFVILLLNRPVLSITQGRVEPSVLAVLIDDSMSMRLADVDPGQTSRSRLEAAIDLMTADDAALIKRLEKDNTLRVFRFDSDLHALEGDATNSIRQLEPNGESSRLGVALQSAANALQGQRVAGIVVLTDGRQTAGELEEQFDSLRERGYKVYPVVIGSEVGLRNVAIESVAHQDSVFSGDIVNLAVSLRSTGISSNESLTLRIVDHAGNPVIQNGNPVEKQINVNDGSTLAEIQFVPEVVGALDVSVEVVPISREIDTTDNRRAIGLTVLDSNISVLYVEGYPRWEYRYLKQDMIRDKSVSISCLLTSADESFAQEGDRPITRFPENLDELLEYDVVILGDVDPRQFTDAQLALIHEFVAKRGGGFGMIAGTRYAPQSYRNTAIEPLLPVDIARVEPTPSNLSITEGWRPIITPDGQQSSIFRFFSDAEQNETYLTEKLQLMFWNVKGVTLKPGIGQVLAQHPTETGPDGRPTPIVVVGRFGAGRTFFEGTDEAWRWRYYTGEQIFTSHWVQTLRYLARGRKLGQRRFTLASERPTYELGSAARLSLRVIDPQMLQSLGNALSVQLVGDDGAVMKTIELTRRAGEGDLFAGGLTADRIGRFSLRYIAPDGSAITSPMEVILPRLEFVDPRADRETLSKLASETGGQLIEFASASDELPKQIKSVRRVVPIITSQPLWSAPIALIAFVVLITLEWIGRKRAGLV